MSPRFCCVSKECQLLDVSCPVELFVWLHCHAQPASSQWPHAERIIQPLCVALTQGPHLLPLLPAFSLACCLPEPSELPCSSNKEGKKIWAVTLMLEVHCPKIETSLVECFLIIVLVLMNSLLLGFGCVVDNRKIELKNSGQRAGAWTIPVLLIWSFCAKCTLPSPRILLERRSRLWGSNKQAEGTFV